MKCIIWYVKTQFLVLFSLAVSVAPQTTLDRKATTAATISKRPPRPRLCPKPLNLTNGYSLGVQRQQGVSIKYFCKQEYQLIGPSNYQCLPFVDPEPKKRKRPILAWDPPGFKTRCEHRYPTTSKSMPPPRGKCWLPQPRNRNVKVQSWGHNYDFYNSVTYTCETGYEIVGQSVYTCMHYGKWSPEEEPNCVQEGIFIHNPPDKSSSTIDLILYITIPVLVIFVLAVLCKLRNKIRKQNRPALAGSSFSEREDASYPQLLPTSETGHEYLAASSYQLTMVPSAPPSHLLNSDEFGIIVVTVDAPSAPLMQEPPSYEDVTRDSGLPSFEAAQKLHNSNTNLSCHSRETLH